MTINTREGEQAQTQTQSLTSITCMECAGEQDNEKNLNIKHETFDSFLNCICGLIDLKRKLCLILFTFGINICLVIYCFTLLPTTTTRDSSTITMDKTNNGAVIDFNVICNDKSFYVGCVFYIFLLLSIGHGGGIKIVHVSK